ncbi:MAG: ABC transporter ATP-binding protein [Paracoccaceae bacterium]
MSAGLTVRDLNYAYGSKQALSDISFTLEAGQFCALLGPNGAGKSTLYAVLTRLLVAPGASVTLAGHDLSQTPTQALAALGIVFQQPTLDLDLTVRQNMRFFAALHGIGGREADRRIDAALDRLDMRLRAHEKARALNGGHRRRTEIARALIHAPRVLLLDEATVGLDAATRAAITQHVHDLADEGITVLWSTHLTDEIRDTDRLLVLHRSRLLHDGMASDLGPDLKARFLQMTETSA